MAIELFRRILVPVDFSPCSNEAFRIALQMARAFQSELKVLHVIDTSAVAAFNRLGLLAVPSDATAQRRRLRHQARLKTRELLESQSTDGIAITRIVIEGAPFVEIAKLARQERIELIVMGSYGGRSESMDKIFFGATAEKVVRTAGCAVLTVPLPARKSRKDRDIVL
ncbi:MAG TPA: universal stress protein [Nitrospira sp.]|nr:universal stress protein [Nitrospira sp.]